MKILVTGGAGYIGSTVTGFLTEKGHKAFVYDNLSHGRRDLLPSGVELIEGELSDRAKLERIFSAARDGNEPFDAGGTCAPVDAKFHYHRLTAICASSALAAVLLDKLRVA